MKHRKTNDVSSSIFLMNDLGKIAKTNIYIYIYIYISFLSKLLSACAEFHSFSTFVTSKKKRQIANLANPAKLAQHPPNFDYIGSMYGTVDGRNPTPPGTYKTL